MCKLGANFDHFFRLCQQLLGDLVDKSDNLQFYPRKPKLSDLQLIALCLWAENKGFFSENQLFNTHRTQISCTRQTYNRRRKRLITVINLINKRIASQLGPDESLFIIDSMPILICKPARNPRRGLCQDGPYALPQIGYCAVNRLYFKGYKLHLLLGAKGLIQSVELTDARVHDVKLLADLKHSLLTNCTIIGDKGYRSEPQRIDLFNYAQIRLETPFRCNEKTFKPQFPSFRRVRKRVETVFSQLCHHFRSKENLAKTFRGLAARIATKIAAFALLQLINAKKGQPLNQISWAKT